MGRLRHTFVIHSTRGLRFVPESDVLWVEAARHYVRLHLGDDTVLHRSTMRDIEDRLSESFVRVHRSYVVRMDLVRELRRRANGSYEVRLAGGDTVPVGDTYLRHARARLEA